MRRLPCPKMTRCSPRALNQLRTSKHRTTATTSTAPRRPARRLNPGLRRHHLPLVASFDPAAAPRRRNTISANAAGVSPPLAMLFPKDGVSWKAARARMPPSRVIIRAVTQTRLLLCVAIAGIMLLVWNGLSGTAGEMQR